jgi:hypothetical protein
MTTSTPPFASLAAEFLAEDFSEAAPAPLADAGWGEPDEASFDVTVELEPVEH